MGSELSVYTMHAVCSEKSRVGRPDLKSITRTVKCFIKVHALCDCKTAATFQTSRVKVG
jgi:hypothetical protein